jgi:serine/threonine-protein kinase RsbW
MAEPAAAIGWAERPEFVHRSWPAYPRHLTALRAEVRRWLAPLALPGDVGHDLLLAVNEAASNCVEHAYTSATVDGTVELTFWTETRSVCVEIVDHGAWRTPTGKPTGCGRGIEIIRRLIPVVLIHYDRRGTRVLLSHPLPGPIARIAAEPGADVTAANLGGAVRSSPPTGATLSAHAPDPASVVVRA